MQLHSFYGPISMKAHDRDDGKDKYVGDDGWNTFYAKKILRDRISLVIISRSIGT